MLVPLSDDEARVEELRDSSSQVNRRLSSHSLRQVIVGGTPVLLLFAPSLLLLLLLSQALEQSPIKSVANHPPDSTVRAAVVQVHS